MAMELIEFQQGGFIEWEGPGTYAAEKMRGPWYYIKVPEGWRINANLDIDEREFAEKPAAYQYPQRRMFVR